MAKERPIDAVALYEQIAAEVSSMLKQPPGINKLLDTKFTRDDIELIYTYLGNGIQHDLCLRFVVSGYDLEVLREDEKKQEVGSDGKA